jgi:hypothetical protein
MPVLLYTATIMPFHVFFEVEESPFWQGVDIAATVLFALDMIMEVNTAYYADNTSARVETRRALILRRYLTGWFIFDLIAVLPVGAGCAGTSASRSRSTTPRRRPPRPPPTQRCSPRATPTRRRTRL